MGAQASKQVGRKFPQQANPEILTQAPKASPSSTNHSETVESATGAPYIADEYRSEAIEEDGKDPDLAKKLTEIGQVNIPELRTKYRTTDPMLQIIRRRNQVENAEEFDPLVPSSQKAENRITIDDLYALLEQRKMLPADASDQHLKPFTEKYPLNQSTIQTLFKYVNNITPFEVGNDDERQRGVWVDNKDAFRRYVEQAQEVTKKQKESRRVDKTDKPSDLSSDAQRKKEKELEELFTD